MAAIALYIAVFVAWNLAISLAIVGLPAAAAIPVVLALSALVVFGFVLGGPRPARRRALVRLRPIPRRTQAWVLISAPVVLFFVQALSEVWVRLVPVPPDTFDPFGPLMRTTGGRVSITVLALLVAPVMEEFFFRGLIQHALERRWGVWAAVAATALLFALGHGLPRVLPLHFFLGLAFGYAVYVTRSIWAGIFLHFVNNAAAMIETGPPAAVPTIWRTGPDPAWWASLGWLLVAAVVLLFTARGLRAAARGRALRPAGAVG
ncbi:MAG TPA: type II CAAX endopeptidase family protein [Longimicrobiaceae bacterium]|nr:type II CAAX endopeptidase family protein [Longimicrobiaceae bacterium]